MQLKNTNLLKNQLLINNQWLDASETFEILNPATVEKIVDLASANKEHTLKAIDAAEVAFQKFRHSLASERAAILRKWASLIDANKQDIAVILTSEMGKPLHEALGELNYTVSKFNWYAGEAERVFGEVGPAGNPNVRDFVLHQPVGVVAAVTPWNWPAGMVANKFAIPVAAGCTVVLKPAEDTPLTSLALAQLGIEAGLPEGVINVLPCANPAEVGDVLMESPKVRKLTFTGSTGVGRMLNEKAASTVKKVTLELGGNAPFIVFDDADLDKAMLDLYKHKFTNAGQVCVSTNRVYIHESLYEAAIEKFAKHMDGIVLGNGLDKGVTQGPQINRKGLDKIERMVADAIQKGARIVKGGKPSDLGHTFFEPTLIADATDEMDVAHDEIFGPVAIFYTFNDDNDVVKKANDTHYGLAGYLYTKDIARAVRVSEALEYGNIGINTTGVGTNATPFGGIKQSGQGTEGGRYGIQEYLDLKTISLNLG